MHFTSFEKYSCFMLDLWQTTSASTGKCFSVYNKLMRNSKFKFLDATVQKTF